MGYSSKRAPRLSSRHLPRLFAVIALLIFLRWFYSYSSGTSNELEDPSRQGAKAPITKPKGSKEFIVASMKGDDISWFREYFRDWVANIYVMDDPRARLTVKKNKGRESSAYLSYLIDNYDNLPDYMVFLHSLRYQWHNEDPMYDGVPMMQNLRLAHIEEEGYANVRCTWTIGCPAEIRPTSGGPRAEHGDADDRRTKSEEAYATSFQELFPNTTVPDAVGIPCGAQFGLSRWKVHERPKADYERYRQWLWDTPLDDSISGRVMEYSWHMIMGKPAIHCPDAGVCFCKKYGMCDLTCTESGCLNRYMLPQIATIPEGWPLVGPGQDGWPPYDWWKQGLF